MYLWNDKKKHMRAGATKIKISWILNKNIMNIWVFFPCLRVSSDRCFDYTGLHSVTLVGAECWCVIVVYIIYDISLVYHVSQTTFETPRQQKDQLLVYIVFHVLPLFRFWIVAFQRQTTKKATFQFYGRFWLASSEAIVLSFGNCKLPTVNKFHITHNIT